jgi:hypothetical protein
MLKCRDTWGDQICTQDAFHDGLHDFEPVERVFEILESEARAVTYHVTAKTEEDARAIYAGDLEGDIEEVKNETIMVEFEGITSDSEPPEPLFTDSAGEKAQGVLE